MTGQELAARVSQVNGVPMYQAVEIMRTVVETMADVLRAGGNVSLSGLGVLDVKNLKARRYRHPRKPGYVIEAQFRRAGRFTASPLLFGNPPSVVVQLVPPVVP